MNKGEELFCRLGDLPDDLIIEADTGSPAGKAKSKKRYGGFAAAAAIVVIAGTVFFAVHNRQNAANIPAQSIKTSNSQDKAVQNLTKGSPVYVRQKNGGWILENYEDMIVYSGSGVGDIYQEPSAESQICGKALQWNAADKLDTAEAEALLGEPVPEGWYGIRFNSGMTGFVLAEEWLSGDKAYAVFQDKASTCLFDPDGTYLLYAQPDREEEPYDELKAGCLLKVNETNQSNWYRLHYQETENAYVLADESVKVVYCLSSVMPWPTSLDTDGQTRQQFMEAVLAMAEKSWEKPYELTEAITPVYLLAEAYVRSGYSLYGDRVATERELQRRLENGRYEKIDDFSYDSLKIGDIVVYTPQKSGPTASQYDSNVSEVPVVGLYAGSGLVLCYDGDHVAVDEISNWAGEPVGYIDMLGRFEADEDYLKLTRPDRIRAYWDEQEKVFLPDEEPYEEIFDSIKTSWDAAKDMNGLFEMVQLLWLEDEALPEDRTRVVFEYDKPINWRVDPDNPNSESEADTYIFFLNSGSSWVVVCKNGNYQERAFLPVIPINKRDILMYLRQALPYYKISDEEYQTIEDLMGYYSKELPESE